MHDIITIRNRGAFTTKSKKFRVIPIHHALRNILKRYRKKSGRCFDTTNYKRIFRRIRRGARLPDMGWHTMRHTFASHLIMSGVDIVTVSRLLGHADIKTTMIYSHLTKDHERNAVKRLAF